jgi:hypothetical protein
LSGTVITLTANPAAHYHLVNWTGTGLTGSDAGSTLSVTMNQDKTITANFAMDQFALVVNSAYLTGGCVPSTGANMLNYGLTYCAVTNSPKILSGSTTQYVCIGWTGTGDIANGSGTNTSWFTLDKDSSITWYFRTNYWLNVDVAGNGSVSASDAWILRGTYVQVVATPSNYCAFSGWQGQTNGCAITGNTISVVMNAPHALTAAFTADLATNNVPKWWLAQYGLTNFDFDAMNDSDGDGMVTWREYLAGTDPTNPASVLRFTSAQTGAVNKIVLRWASVSNHNYNLRRATNLLASTNAFVILSGASHQRRGSVLLPD